jgi:hypothetical protein
VSLIEIKKREVRGISFSKLNNKWRARISVGKDRLSLGLFPDEESAIKAYQDATIKYFGGPKQNNIPEHCGGMTKMKISQDKVTTIDSNDYEILSKYKWYASKDGRNHYEVRTSYWDGEKVKHISMSRFLLDDPEGKQVDHINGDTLDNRRCNLRICEQEENAMNQKKAKSYGGNECSSQYKGVNKNKKTGKITAYISHNCKRIHLGTFTTEEMAAAAYDEAAIKYFGEFAKINL